MAAGERWPGIVMHCAVRSPFWRRRSLAWRAGRVCLAARIWKAARCRC